MHIVTWYSPGGSVLTANFHNVVFSRRLPNGDQEIRLASNFRIEFEGVYMCVITDGDSSSQHLYIGVYKIIEPNFTRVNLGIYSRFEGSVGAVLVLNCSSSALPVLTASWYFNNQPIAVGERTQHIPNRRSSTYNTLLVIRRDELLGTMQRGPGQYSCLLESRTSSVYVTQALNLGKFIPVADK